MIVHDNYASWKCEWLFISAMMEYDKQNCRDLESIWSTRVTPLRFRVTSLHVSTKGSNSDRSEWSGMYTQALLSNIMHSLWAHDNVHIQTNSIYQW